MRRSHKREAGSGILGFRLLLLVFYSLFSCSTTGNIADFPNHIIEDVPFYPQEALQCGPSSLAGVMNYWGAGVSTEEVAKDIYSESARGTLDIDMVIYPQKKGFAAEQYSGSIDDLKEKIDVGYPLVALVDFGFSILQVNHFMVVIGYNDNGVIVNSGKERAKFIPLKDFIKTWERTKFWTLLIKNK